MARRGTTRRPSSPRVGRSAGRAGGRDAPDAHEIACLLCGEGFRAVTPHHLRARHDWLGDHPLLDYKRHFGLAVACSRETRRLTRAASVLRAVRDGRHWTRTTVQLQLRRRQSKGLTLTSSRVPAVLYSAARRLFGSWAQAMRGAGLDLARYAVRGRWTRARILDAIRARRDEGRPLSDKGVMREARSLHMAAARQLGNWGNALRAAGLDPAEHREPPKWSLEAAVGWIDGRLARGQPITHAHVPLGLVGWVARNAGMGWVSFVEASGRPYPYRRSRTAWTPALVVEAIRERRRRRLPLNYKGVAGDHQSLVQRGLRYYGTWDQALRAAGIEPERIRRAQRWTRKSVVAALRERHAAGRRMNRKAVELEAPRLVSAIRYRFPDWGAALHAAGIDPTLHRGLPTPTPPSRAARRHRTAQRRPGSAADVR